MRQRPPSTADGSGTSRASRTLRGSAPSGIPCRWNTRRTVSRTWGLSTKFGDPTAIGTVVQVRLG